MRILIVDDEVSVGHTLESMLTQLGHSSEVVTSAVEAVTKFAEQPYDLVLTDMGMPEMTGLELACRLKSIAPRLRVILMTGWPVPPTLDELAACGVESVLSKPLSLHSVLSVIDRSDES